jgi:hypothetical protein
MSNESKTLRYGAYIINRLNPRNLVLHKEEEVTAGTDIKNPRTGEILHDKGEVYQQTTFVGFYGSLTAALRGIVKSRLGDDCEDLHDVLKQIKQLEVELKTPDSI